MHREVFVGLQTPVSRCMFSFPSFEDGHMRSLVLLVGLLPLGSIVAAQEIFKNVEYISGHAGMNDKVKGMLTIGDNDVQFTDEDGTLVFKIPLEGITEINNQTDIRDAALGKKLLLGAFAGSRKQEFVNISYETTNMAEGIVFKVKQGTSTGIVAKIRFAAKHRKGEAPATAPTTTNQPPPPK
jgi:hypothetical protein